MDTSVLINFLCIDRMDLIARHSHQFIVTDHVAAEVGIRRVFCDCVGYIPRIRIGYR